MRFLPPIAVSLPRPLPVRPLVARLRPWPVPVWPPRLLRAAVAAGCAALGALLAWMVLVETWGRLRAADYLAFDRAARGTLLQARDGRALGIMPVGDADVPPGFVRRVVWPVERVPDVWFAVLVALEDRHAGSWRHVYGLDVAALAAVPLELMRGRRRGGSSLAMQLARSMRAMTPDADRGLYGLAARKAMELLDGPALWRATGGLGGGRFERLLADHLPLVIGTRGSPLGGTIYGVGPASLTLFGLPPEALDPARQAVLAAAVRRPIPVAARQDARGLRLARKRWAYLRRRAIFGVRHAFPDGPARDRLIAAIRALPPPPVVDGALPTSAFPHRVHPVLYARRLFGRGLETVRAGLGKEVPGTLRLSLDADLQRRLQAGFRQERARLERMFPEWDRRAPRLLVALVNEHGAVRAFATDSYEPLLFGLVRDKGGGLRPWGVRTGSVAKIAAALALAARDGPRTRWCARAFGDPPVHDPDGSKGHADCGKPDAWVSARESFARSLNLPLLDRLGRLPEARLRRAAGFLGLRLPEDVPVRVALATGHARVAPVELLASLAVLHRYLDDGEVRPVCPHLLERQDAPCRDGRVLATLLPDRGSRSRLRALLRAPFDRRGTLASLAGFARRHPDAIGKSGTDRVRGLLLARWITGAFTHRGEHLAFVVVAAAPDARRPLPEGLAHAHLARFVRVIERAVGPPGKSAADRR